MEKTIQIPAQITVKDLADKMELPLADLLKKLMENGIMSSMNEMLDFETAYLISEELGFKVELDKKTSSEESISFDDLREILNIEKENAKDLSPRPPVVTILGHVDHGKTTLLDTLKKTHIAEKEAGGITQHISAYQVEKDGKMITFVDTPGHEAFQSMRQRGAMIADIVILVVAADDGVKPQTKEVIDFINKNRIPTIVAINKIDKPEANVNKVKQNLAENNILLEGYGGDVPFNEISAKSNIGLEELLSSILKMADEKKYVADESRDALGVVLEAHKDTQKGSVATVLIKTGTLKIGQNIMTGDAHGKARRIEDYAGKSIQSASPSMPVSIVGLNKAPQSHSILQIMDESSAKKRKMISNINSPGATTAQPLSSKQLISTIDEKLKTHFYIILKADVQGTLEALKQIIDGISTEEVVIEIVESGVGTISESEVKKAQSGDCIIYGFNVKTDPSAGSLAKNIKVDIRSFNIIYELIEDLKKEVSKLLKPDIEKKELGKLKILAIFKTGKNSCIAGGKVSSGKMIKGEKIEIERNGEIIDQGKLVQLQQSKEDVAEVKESLECGITYEGKENIEVGDILICFKEEEREREI